MVFVLSISSSISLVCLSDYIRILYDSPSLWQFLKGSLKYSTTATTSAFCNYAFTNVFSITSYFSLTLASQPSLGLGLLHKIRLNFLEASQQFSFYRVRLLAPRPTPIPEGQPSVFISPKGRVATHFSRLLRHAWVTVGLFLLPGHHTGI
jgi:hypothetical protein